MYLVGVLLLCTFLGHSGCFDLDDNSNKLYDADWQCATICQGSGGKAVFDQKNKICKCTVDAYIDGTEAELMMKNAKNMGLQIIKSPSEYSHTKKREADTPVQEKEESIVGQKVPKFKFNLPQTRSSVPHSLVRTVTNNKRPFITQPKKKYALPVKKTEAEKSAANAQKRFKEIQHEINERRKARARKASHFQTRAGFTDASKPKLIEKIKLKQKELQEKLKTRNSRIMPRVGATQTDSDGKLQSPVVGANQNLIVDNSNKVTNTAKPHEKSTKEEESDKAVIPIFEIITQDPSLYKDE